MMMIKWVHEISEASLRMLETCGNSMDVLSFAKDHLHQLQSASRRRVTTIGADHTSTRSPTTTTTTTGGNIINSKLYSGYSLQRKKLKKAMLRRLQSLKEMKRNNRCINSSSSSMSSLSHDHLGAVVNVLRQVRTATVAIVEALMSLMLSMPDPKSLMMISTTKSANRGSFFQGVRFMNHVGDSSLSCGEDYCDNNMRSMMVQEASKRMEAVEMGIDVLEQELDCIFKRLIQTRVSLLNILTTH